MEWSDFGESLPVLLGARPSSAALRCELCELCALCGDEGGAGGVVANESSGTTYDDFLPIKGLGVSNERADFIFFLISAIRLGFYTNLSD